MAVKSEVIEDTFVSLGPMSSCPRHSSPLPAGLRYLQVAKVAKVADGFLIGTGSILLPFQGYSSLLIWRRQAKDCWSN
jgi:hypothetical protein